MRLSGFRHRGVSRCLCLILSLGLVLPYSVEARVNTGALRKLASAPVPGGNAPLQLQAPQLDTLDVQSAPEQVSEPEVNKAPDLVQSLLVQAVSAYSQGQNADAKVLFQKVLNRDPGNGDAHYNLGAMAEQDGNLPEALYHYQAALRANPQERDYQDAARTTTDKLASMRALEAKQVADQEAQTRDLTKVAEQAKSAYKSGNFDQAIANLNRLEQAAPNDAEIQFGLAQAYRAKGNFNQARVHLNSAIAIDPNNTTYRQTYTSLNNDAIKQSSQGQVAEAAPPGQITPMEGNSGNSDIDGGGEYGRYKGGSQKTRLVRAAGVAAAGAAVGALLGGLTTKYDRKGGALRGAIFGGSMGLMMGGF